MPVACSTSALTGQDGSLYYTPSATKFCLLDFTDFPAGTSITVPAQHDFRIGDPLVFEEENGGKLCTPLPPGAQYYVVAKTATTIDCQPIKAALLSPSLNQVALTVLTLLVVTSGLSTTRLVRSARFSPGTCQLSASRLM